MTGKKNYPDYIANTVVEGPEEGQDRWTNIGVAFVNNKSNTITVLMDAVPVNGKVILTLPKKPDEE